MKSLKLTRSVLALKRNYKQLIMRGFVNKNKGKNNPADFD